MTLNLKKISVVLCALFVSAMFTIHSAQANSGFVDIPKKDEA